MKNRNKKLWKAAGFTLIEMLIVVAIVAVLVAVSIPLVGNALEQARDNTDLANERSAKTVASMVYLGVSKIYTIKPETIMMRAAEEDGPTYTEYPDYKAGTSTDRIPLYYDAAGGKLITGDSSAGITPYGKCSKDHGDGTFADGDDDGKHNDGNHGIISLYISATGTVSLGWNSKYGEWRAQENLGDLVGEEGPTGNVADKLLGMFLPDKLKEKRDAAFAKNPDLTMEQFLTDEGMYAALWSLDEENAKTYVGQVLSDLSTSTASLGTWWNMSYLTEGDLNELNQALETIFKEVQGTLYKSTQDRKDAIYEELVERGWIAKIDAAYSDHDTGAKINKNMFEESLFKAYTDYVDKNQPESGDKEDEEAKYQEWRTRLTGNDDRFLTYLENRRDIHGNPDRELLALIRSKVVAGESVSLEAYATDGGGWMAYNPDENVSKWYLPALSQGLYEQYYKGKAGNVAIALTNLTVDEIQAFNKDYTEYLKTRPASTAPDAEKEAAATEILDIWTKDSQYAINNRMKMASRSSLLYCLLNYGKNLKA